MPISGFMRWLTVSPPDQPDLQLALMLPGPPAYDDSTAEQIRELVSKGAAGGGVIFETDDCRRTYEQLRAAGVEFTQEPTERFYGTDCGLRDPFGNPMRFTQPPDGPVVRCRRRRSSRLRPSTRRYGPCPASTSFVEASTIVFGFEIKWLFSIH